MGMVGKNQQHQQNILQCNKNNNDYHNNYQHHKQNRSYCNLNLYNSADVKSSAFLIKSSMATSLSKTANRLSSSASTTSSSSSSLPASASSSSLTTTTKQIKRRKNVFPSIKLLCLAIYLFVFINFLDYSPTVLAILVKPNQQTGITPFDSTLLASSSLINQKKPIKKQFCNSGQFTCNKSLKCLPEHWKCDGDYDCGAGDISDELDCPKMCPPNQSNCSHGECIDIAKFCDGKFDCMNDEDFKFCENSAEKCAKLHCSYDCRSTPDGPKCYCPVGQSPNGTLCEDRDECQMEGSCDQLCKNTPGSFECSCISGYEKKGNRCIAQNYRENDTAIIVFATGEHIKRLSLIGDIGNSECLVGDIYAMDFSHRNRTICLVRKTYIKTMTDALPTMDLQCYKYDNFSKQFKLPRPDLFSILSSIDQLRLDWISGNWYFLNTDTGIIFMCSQEITHCTIIIDGYQQELKSMALDPTTGLMFISKWDMAAIERTQLDGSNRTEIVNNKIFYPLSITLDLANKQIYWIDVYQGWLERVNYDGKSRWSLQKSAEWSLQQLHSVTIFENKIYLSARNKSHETIIEIDKGTRKMINTHIEIKDFPDKLHVIQQQRQPVLAHPCSNQNGGCEHLCIPSYKGSIMTGQCICSAGYRLVLGKKCVFIKNDLFLLYSKLKPFMIKGINVNLGQIIKNDTSINKTSGSSSSVLSINAGSNSQQQAMVPILVDKDTSHAFDYNVRDQLIYFFQYDVPTSECNIMSQKFDGTDRKIIIDIDKQIHYLAYDWIGHNLYWTTVSRIGVISLTNITHQKELLSESYISSLVLDPNGGRMYWTSPLPRPVIEQSWMDGTNRSVLIDLFEPDYDEVVYPTSLTIDYVSKKLFYCIRESGTIESIDFNGENREIILSAQTLEVSYFEVRSIAYHNSFIFWNENGTTINRYKLNQLKKLKNQPSKIDRITIINESIGDLKIFDNTAQTNANNCSNQISCPGILLPTPAGCLCSCGDGLTLNASGTKCMPKLNYNRNNHCKEGTFQCKNNGQCVDERNLCDGDYDCGDRSDEVWTVGGPCYAAIGQNCTYLNGTINSLAFRCDETRCISSELICNGQANCNDGKDELKCEYKKCADNMFQCTKTKKCIPNSWVCDHNFDCEDKSDEHQNCPTCEFTCNNGACVLFEQLCDGVNNCGDMSDEKKCDCQPSEYFCHPSGCISISQICDGINDCLDASDESDCPPFVSSDNFHENFTLNIPANGNVCAEGYFECSINFECIPENKLCDGHRDCADDTDELVCDDFISLINNTTKKPIENEECEYPNRLCRPTGLCITVQQFCDGINNCPDGSDEGNQCVETMCDRSTDCSHYCHNSPEGYICSCPVHMFLKSNGLTCSREHACTHWGTCSQNCNQLGKRYECQCQDGYTLEFDGFSCRSNNGDSPFVIFSNRNEIRSVDLKTLAVRDLYTSLRNTIALDFLFGQPDETNQTNVQIFWTDVVDDKIYRGSLIGDVILDVEAVVQSGLLTAEGLAVDWIGQNLYWVDSKLDQIEVAGINGSFRRTIIAGGISSPRAIVLDPRDGLLFWSDWDTEVPRIERSSMAGDNRRTIVNILQVKGAWPNGITLDYVLRRVYWIDARSDSIHSTDYNGGDHHMVIKDAETLSHPFGITVFENYVYWTDWRSNSVFRASKWNGSDISVLQRTQTQPFGIQILHSSRQPRDGPNPCSPNNGGCSHLCLLNTNKTFKCECPHVMRLGADQKTCIPNDQVLLFVVDAEIRGVDLMQPNHHAIPTISHSSSVLGPSVIDYLINETQIFWADINSHEVKTAGISNGLIETILDTSLDHMSGFAIDWISKNIYIATIQEDNSQILACNIRGEYLTLIHKDLLNVVSLVVDAKNGILYWSHQNEDSKLYLIEKSLLDGQHRQIIVNCTEPAQNLTLDFVTERLYFMYTKQPAILYVDLKTSTVIKATALKENHILSSITVYKGDIYYAESTTNTTRKCAQNDCTNSSILRNNTGHVMALKMYYPDAQLGTNGCAQKNGNCEHLCFGLPGNGVSCKCAIGYYKLTNDNKCIGEDPFLLISVSHELKGLRFTDPSITMTSPSFTIPPTDKVLTPLQRISLASNIDYHFEKELIFWADAEKNTISSIKRTGTDRKVIMDNLDQFEISSSIEDWLGGIAIDWIADNIYWSDFKRNIIEVSRLNGTYRYAVVTNIQNPKAIAVDPISGYLFYVGDQRIGRTGLDGSGHFILANHSSQIRNLVLDIGQQVVYFCDASKDEIWRVDYDGNRKQCVLNESLQNPVALAVLDGWLYWADSSHMNGSIQMAPITNLTDMTTLVANEGYSLVDLKIFSKQIQMPMNGTTITVDCTQNNGGCEQLCLFNGTHPICACSHGVLSERDGKTCEPYDSFLIYSRVTSIASIHMSDSDNIKGPIQRIRQPDMIQNTIGLAYDFKNELIFYSDVQLSTINAVYFNGTNHTVIVNRQFSVEGLAFEPITQTLFWTSNSNSSIRAIEMNLVQSNLSARNLNYVKTIIQLSGLDKPRGLTIESCLAMIYWTNWNVQAASIQRAYTAGYGIESIITTDIIMPNAIALDYEEHKLYWSDARLDKIERANYDGTERTILSHSKPQHPFAMAVYGDLIYWTDWLMHAVVRADKETGANVILLRKNIRRPMGIVAIQNTTKECSSSKCEVANGGCEDVCSELKNGGIKCECTKGALAADGHHCVPLNSGCQHGQFMCKSSNECIPFHLTCDHINHCIDGSDENINFCNYRPCLTGYFRCQNHRCIANNLTCNGKEDCGDGTDEANCECDPKKHFKCSSGQCIDLHQHCDQHRDCPDGSDELHCLIQCDAGFEPCASHYQCFGSKWRCDGEADCHDKSDELNCPVTECGVGQFKCSTGQCINILWRCDSETDCSDASDEKDCNLRDDDISKSCKPNQFQCQDSDSQSQRTCIPMTWQCDGTSDCIDGSDEGEHCKNSNCSKHAFRCPSTGRCIPMHWLCDGDEDCAKGGEDEKDCTSDSFCLDGEFTCGSRECIDIQLFCDGQIDCRDGTDEFDGCVKSTFLTSMTCEFDEFSCANSKCISKTSVCNNKDDCGDNSDEATKLCENSTLVCAEPRWFRCQNGACVNNNLLCNGEDDCGDYSDEHLCNINECRENINSKLCEQVCKDKKIGYECACFKGYVVSKVNPHLCDDIDECELERPCNQLCNNTDGGYRCDCIDGYHLVDRNKCKSTSDIPMKLIFSNRYYIREINHNGPSSLLINNQTNTVALDFEWETKCLFWSDVTSAVSKIKSFCPGDAQIKDLHSSMMKNPDGLAIDWVAKNLYWCDKGLDTIEVSQINGRYRRVLLRENLQEPRGIALDPFAKYIYWTDWGERPHIGRSGMDGSNPKLLVEENLGWPNALTISFESNELYWGDARDDFIAVSDLNGENRRVIISRNTNPNVNLHHIFAIAIWEDHIYWSDWETKSIESCQKDWKGGSNCSTVYSAIHRPMDVRVFHPYRQRQPVNGNPCANSTCSTLCLLSPNSPTGYRCMCPDNFILDPNDNQTCLANCTSAHFVCKSTHKCIPFYWQCDGHDDCGDGSDEPSECPPFNCRPGQYQCKNNNCIQPTQICNGNDDCGDRSDEKDCENFVCFDTHIRCSASTNSSAFCIGQDKQCNGHQDCPNGDDENESCEQRTCPPQKFRCGHGKCIPRPWVCDNEFDCEDESDEKNCSNNTCLPGHFQCPKSGRCIPHSWVCDGEPDCSHEEDETDACLHNGTNTCDATYFRCISGKCIPGRYRCDYQQDCEDDELNCEMRNCSESEFRCDNGRCIKGSLKCDGEYNCDDFSDEASCNKTCAADEFMCPNKNACINIAFVCDGDRDCVDGADELNCTCPPDHFKCDNGRCLMNRWRCDGFNDCMDDSDETSKLCARTACGPNAFRCRNKRCIPKSVYCDGNDDCGDRSDEFDCPARLRCHSEQFQCERDRFCIHKQFHCDGEPNCIDDSDEINCPSKGCGFARCSQICDEKKSGHIVCSCANGYDNYAGGVERRNSHPCVATSDENTWLLIASDSKINVLELRSHNRLAYSILPEASLKIDELDILILNNGAVDLFWIDSHNRNVQKLPDSDHFNTENRQTRSVATQVQTIITNLEEPKSLAVDWITKRLYVIDAGKRNHIVSTDLMGGNPVEIISTGPYPLDLVLDPNANLLIWSTMNEGILSASMDGANKQALVQGGVEWPTGLTIDYTNQRLYWADQRMGKIETCLYNGKDRHIVRKFTGISKHPRKLALFEDSLYAILMDQSIVKLHKYNKDNQTAETLFGSNRATDLIINHSLKQPKNKTNACERNMCPDNSVCLLSAVEPYGRSCKCLPGFNKTMTGECELIAKPCDLNCHHGKCIFYNNEKKCLCPHSYNGLYCEKYRCLGYCKNRGKCQIELSNPTDDSEEVGGELPPLKCLCPSQWTGDRCEIDASTCKEMCHNGAACTFEQSSSTDVNGSEINLGKSRKIDRCICSRGFSGEHCENCDDLVCENQGICKKNASTGDSECECQNGYQGEKCENGICDGFCSGNGDCTIRLGSPMCTCYKGFWGNQCQSDSCNNFCENGGICSNDNAEMRCECTSRYRGYRCQTPVCPNNQTCPEDDYEICTRIICYNNGVCHAIHGEPICNCTLAFTGADCTIPIGNTYNLCTDYCENNGICHLNASKQNPKCTCVGDWVGEKCESPPRCIGNCGECQAGSSLNECLCSNGSVVPCIQNNADTKYDETESYYAQTREQTGHVLTILSIIITILILLIGVFGGAIYYLRKRRIDQPFSHARLNDNVEITNPMYIGDLDDQPAFIRSIGGLNGGSGSGGGGGGGGGGCDDDKGNFANPVYESMYAGSSEPVLLTPLSSSGMGSGGGGGSGIGGGGISSKLSSSSMNASDEKKGLLQHSQDDSNNHDLL